MITILENSYINSGTTDYYLNKDDFDSRILFTSTGSTLHYAVVREEITTASDSAVRYDKIARVIKEYGVLTGIENNGLYQYRYNFKNFIFINNQKNINDVKEISFSRYDSYESMGDGYLHKAYYSTGCDYCKLYLIVSSDDFMTNNIRLNNIIQRVNDDLEFHPEKNINDIVADDKLTLKFIDRSEPFAHINIQKEITNNDFIYYPKDRIFNFGDYFYYVIYKTDEFNPFYNYLQNVTVRCYFSTYNQFGGRQENWFTIQSYKKIKLENNDNYAIVKFKIPESPYYYKFDSIKFSTTNTDGDPSLYFYYKKSFDIYYNYPEKPNESFVHPKLKNCKFLYYYNKEHYFTRILCEGVNNKTSTISRDYLQIGDKTIQYGIDKTNKIKLNTGYNITEEQMHDIMVSPYLYLFDEETEEYKEYVLETSEFGGYNGKKLSNKNIELILLDPKQYKIRTNYNLNFFD